jgi:hypothetical protein
MELNERVGASQKLRNGLALLSILARIAALVGGLYLAFLVLGGALAGAMQVVTQLLPLIGLAAAVAAVCWSLVPLARMGQKVSRDAIGKTAWRFVIALITALWFSPQFGLISEESMLKWITIGSATLLILLYAYKYLHQWCNSWRRSAEGRGASEQRPL